MKFRIAAATVLLTSTFGHSVLAQQAAATDDASASASTGTTTTSVAAQPTAAPAPPPPVAAAAATPAAVPAEASQPAPAAPPAGEAATDHDAMVGRVAIGYLGYVNIPYGALTGVDVNQPTDPSRLAAAPIIGVRLWINSTLGIDAGLGVTTTFGTQKAEAPGVSASTNATAPTGLAVHFGLPLALKAGKHYAFEVIPEANFGYAQQAIANPQTNLGTDHSGMHLDVGARAGAEIHFGFIGVPELSLVGSVGLRVDVNQTKTEDKAQNTTVTDTRTIIHTTLGENPWDIFVGNVSALYYL